MKSPDEIKKGLEYLSIKDIVKKLDAWKEGIAYDYAEDAAADALAYIQQLEAQVPKWISMEDERKPKVGQHCLCICTLENDPRHEWDYMMVLRWMGDCDNGYVNRPHFQHEGMEGMKVTHWMPQPKPPVKEGSDDPV